MNQLLVDDHAELDELLHDAIGALSRHDLDEAYSSVDLFWARLAIHIRAEHLVLFPALLVSAESGVEDVGVSLVEVRSAIARLRHEHDVFMREFATAIASLRKLRSGAVQTSGHELIQVRNRVDAIANLIATHNEREEEGVYCWIRSLPFDKQVSVANGIKKELSNMPSRFKKA